MIIDEKNKISGLDLTIYDDSSEGLRLYEHYRLYPDHPWNKWKLVSRDDENDYTRGNYRTYVKR